MDRPKLGVVADDYTGGSDVAAALRRAGVSTSLVFGVPDDLAQPDSEAVVVALKTRTAPVADAVADSLEAVRWLVDGGASRLYVKYCSTFDSTAEGNIGPVVDAIMDAADVALTLICPATPEHGRTVYQGHLFVGDRLLSESSMATHPLTPMTNSDLREVLRPQTVHAVGLLDMATVRAGSQRVRERLGDLGERGVRHVVSDAISEADLDVLAEATGHLAVVTGAAGLAGAMARHTSRLGVPPAPAAPEGRSVVVAGSCSAQTLRQVAVAIGGMPSLRLDPTAFDEQGLADQARVFIDRHRDAPRLLVYSSADADERRAASEKGMRVDGPGLERALAAAARHAVDQGARRVVVAGGETSGAVVQALGARIVDVGAEAARGVPWCLTRGDDPVALLLKSGNFGDDELLERESR